MFKNVQININIWNCIELGTDIDHQFSLYEFSNPEI